MSTYFEVMNDQHDPDNQYRFGVIQRPFTIQQVDSCRHHIKLQHDIGLIKPNQGGPMVLVAHKLHIYIFFFF